MYIYNNNKNMNMENSNQSTPLFKVRVCFFVSAAIVFVLGIIWSLATDISFEGADLYTFIVLLGNILLFLLFGVYTFIVNTNFRKYFCRVHLPIIALAILILISNAIGIVIKYDSVLIWLALGLPIISLIYISVVSILHYSKISESGETSIFLDNTELAHLIGNPPQAMQYMEPNILSVNLHEIRIEAPNVEKFKPEASKFEESRTEAKKLEKPKPEAPKLEESRTEAQKVENLLKREIEPTKNKGLKEHIKVDSTGKVIWKKTHLILAIDCSQTMYKEWDKVKDGLKTYLERIKHASDVIISLFTFDSEVWEGKNYKTPARLLEEVTSSFRVHSGESVLFSVPISTFETIMKEPEAENYSEWLHHAILITAQDGEYPEDTLQEFIGFQMQKELKFLFTSVSRSKQARQMEKIATTLNGFHYSAKESAGFDKIIVEALEKDPFN